MVWPNIYVVDHARCFSYSVILFKIIYKLFFTWIKFLFEKKKKKNRYPLSIWFFNVHKFSKNPHVNYLQKVPRERISLAGRERERGGENQKGVVVTLMMVEDGTAEEKMETAKTFLTDKALSLSLPFLMGPASNPTPTVTYPSTVSQQHCEAFCFLFHHLTTTFLSL